LLFYTFESLWTVPYQSLGYEMTPDYHERTAVMGVQSFFTQLCGVSYQWLFPLAQLAVFGSVIAGIHWVTTGVAVLVFVIVGMIPGLFVRERFVAAANQVLAARASFWAGCAAVLRNRGLRVLVILGVLIQIAGFLVSGLDYYVLVYYVCAGDIAQGSIWKGVLSSAYSIVGLMSIGGVAWFSRRFDKRNALIGIYCMVAVGGLGKWFFFRAGLPWLCLLDPLLCGPIYTASGMIAQSMVADICDEDEWKHGERREGLFAGAYSWMAKVAISLALLGAGLALNLVGFDAAKNAHQDPHALLLLRYVLVLATTIPALLAIFVLRYYPLNQTRAQEIRSDLEARRGAL
jgi:GPH family glycoside/pentoside/hexuronide:cation symporter